jgi:hypothetical protein
MRFLNYDLERSREEIASHQAQNSISLMDWLPLRTNFAIRGHRQPLSSRYRFGRLEADRQSLQAS